MGGHIMDYVMGGLKTVVGLGSQIFAPGNPIGLSMAGSGIGQLAGGASGNKNLAALGSDVGGMAGGFSGGGGPIPAGDMGGISNALASDPALKGITPDMVTGYGPGAGTNWLRMLGTGGSDLLGTLAQGAAAVKPSRGQPDMPQARIGRTGAGPTPDFNNITLPVQAGGGGMMAPLNAPGVRPPQMPNVQILRSLGLII